jgi:predicted aspartyl protease
MFMELFMLRAILGYLIRILPVVAGVAFGLMGDPNFADEIPTQIHQHLHKVDYVPAKMGTLLLGMPLVHVKVNSIADATFLVDTGTNNSTISTDLAKRLGLRLQPAVNDAGMPIRWKGKQGVMAQVTLLEIGQIKANNGYFYVMDDKDFRATSGSTFEGIIGANILQNSAILLDAQQHILGFCLPGALSPGELKQIGFPQPYMVPLTRTTGNQWWVQAQFSNGSNSGSESLLLDTGSDSTSLSGQLAQKVGFKVTGQENQKDALGKSIVDTGRVDSIHIADLALLDFPLTVQSSEEIPPVLGMNILSGYRVLIDFPAKKMYLQSNTTTAVPAITVSPAPAPAVPPAK